jgi:CHAT domain-containing protein/tetratricopeptide (TPR) repeat protein
LSYSRALFDVVSLIALLGALCFNAFACLADEPNADPSAAGAQKAKAAVRLDRLKPIASNLTTGESRTFYFTASANQFLRVGVEQRGADVSVVLYAPDGSKLLESDYNNGQKGGENLAALVAKAGRYRVVVTASSAAAGRGAFTITLEELRPATKDDTARVEATRLFAEGQQLFEQRSGESRKKAIESFRRSIEQARDAHDKDLQCGALYLLGQALRADGKPQEAVGYYEQALALFQDRKDRAGEANVLNSLGITYDALRQKDKSLEYYERALPIFEELNLVKGRGETLNNIGNYYRTTANYKKALEYFDRARKDIVTFDDRSRIIFYNNLGLTYRQLGDWQKALDSHGEALKLAETLSDRELQTTTLRLFGQLYEAKGETDKALDYLDKQLPIFRATKDRRGEADTLNRIGEVYRKRGDGERALQFYDQSLAIFQAESDLQGVAAIYNNMALVYRVWGEFQKSLDNYQKVLETDRVAKSPKGYEGQTLNNLGQVYFYLNDLPKALELYNQALTIFEQVGDRLRVSYALNNIGQSLSAQGELEKALGHFERALAIRVQQRDRAGEAATLGNIAEVYRKQNAYPKSLEFNDRALAAAREVKNQKLEALTLVGLGKTHQALGRLDKAQSSFEAALTLVRQTRDRATEIETLYGLGLVARDRGDLDLALKHVEAIIKLIEDVRNEIKQPDLRISYFAYVQQFYGFYIDLLMRMNSLKPGRGYAATALEVSERARARSLLELLAEAQADIRQGIEPTLLDKERSLRRALNARAERQLLLLSGPHSDSQADAIEGEINALKAQLLEVEAEIRARSPRYASLTQPQPLTLAQIQQQTLDSETMLLEYWLGPDRSYLWAVTAKGMQSFELPARNEIETVARRFYELLTDPRNKLRAVAGTRGLKAKDFAKQDEDFASTGRRLSEMLLGPIAAELHHDRLLIVADGALHYVPFTALPQPKAPRRSSKSADEETRFRHLPMVARHEIIALPSASTLAILRRETSGRTAAQKMLAILADPVFDQNDMRVIKTRAATMIGPPSAAGAERGLSIKLSKAAADVGGTTETVIIKRLPETRREADSIAQYVPDGERLEALDFDANRDMAISDRLSAYRYVHIATHGFLNSIHPELSGIVLSLVDANGAQRSGFLLAHEFYNLKLPAELVVLSACQTGLGQEVRGEGLIGLTRGLMYAGAARVVVSLWNVDDAATAELMGYFYKKLLKREKTPSESLRDAQIKMIESKQWSAPYFWAAFVLQGEWR